MPNGFVLAKAPRAAVSTMHYTTILTEGSAMTPQSLTKETKVVRYLALYVDICFIQLYSYNLDNYRSKNSENSTTRV